MVMSMPMRTVGRRPPVGLVAMIATLAVSACSWVALPTGHADPVTTTALVLKVVDGDTVDIVDDVRGRLRIRLLGIDTPETKKPGFTVGCGGPEATEFAKSTLVGQRVAFITDPSQDQRDRYGRTLAYLEKADGWDYSVEAARAAWPTPTSTAVSRSRATHRSTPPNRRPNPRAGACGARPASDTPTRCANSPNPIAPHQQLATEVTFSSDDTPATTSLRVYPSVKYLHHGDPAQGPSIRAGTSHRDDRKAEGESRRSAPRSIA